jgi:hypothetical protein
MSASITRSKKSVFATAIATAVAALAAGTLSVLPAHAATVGSETPTSIGAIGSSLGGSLTRAQILQRGVDWVNAAVPYNDSTAQGWSDSTVGGPYREDCSGFVSMAWGLTASLTSQTLPSVATVIPTSQLQPGDALDYTAEHAILFDQWVNQSAGTFDYYYESSGTGKTIEAEGNFNDATLDSWPTSDYEALRYNHVAAAGTAMPAGGTLGDVTGDGEPDIMAIDSTGNLWMYPYVGGSGTSTFGAQVQMGTGWTGFTIDAVADLYHSGRSGLLVTAPNGNLMYYANGGGDNLSTFAVSTQVGSGWSGYRILGLTDLYGTGSDGIVAVDPSGNLLYYPNTGGTGTSTFGSPTTIGTGWSGYTADVADINGDGKPDLLAVDSSGNLWMYPNTGGSGTSTFGARVQMGTGWNTWQAVDAAAITPGQGADIIAIDASGNLLHYTNAGGSNTSTYANVTQIGDAWTGIAIN